MPWITPTLSEIRRLNRDFLTAQLASGVMVPNSALRVMADANGGLAHLNLLYLDWLSRQFLPDTAETEWLERHANIWLANSDGSRGRKAASFASGTALFTGASGVVVPISTQLLGRTGQTAVAYETTADVTIGAVGTAGSLRAIDAGSAGNLETGTRLALQTAITGADATAAVVLLTGGADIETDDELRVRVLDRIREPPMGGAAHDYVTWALAVPGVTRAWCSPLEMGIGTVTVRFMMDDLRADRGGFPTDDDIAEVSDYIETVRPVTARDIFVVSPVAEPINLTLTNLDSDDAGTLANIQTSLLNMLRVKAAPAFSHNGVRVDAQTIYEAWVSEAVSHATGVNRFDLVDFEDKVMPHNGAMATLGNIIRG